MFPRDRLLDGEMGAEVYFGVSLGRYTCKEVRKGGQVEGEADCNGILMEAPADPLRSATVELAFQSCPV